MTATRRAAAALALLGALAACGDALVYSERTSFDLASIRLNDDAAQPLGVSLGFNRQVVTVAPPLGGTTLENGKPVASGQAVSQFSTFRVEAVPAFVGEPQPTLLAVRSRFASGEAALEIAQAPKVVAAVMGLTPLRPLPVEVAEKQGAYLTCINRKLDHAALLQLARDLGFQLGSTETATPELARMAITDRLVRTADWEPLYPTLDAACR
jgi:hypothetical protein